MMSMRFRIAAAAACALLLAGPASAQLIGSGHVMGNGTASPAAPTDTALSAIMGQTGSGMASGVAGFLGVAPNTNGGMATIGAVPVNGQCAVWNSSGKLASIACTPAGSGTVGAGSQNQFSYYSGAGSTTSVVGMGSSNLLLGPNVNNVVSGPAPNPSTCNVSGEAADPTGVCDSSAAFNAAITAALAGSTGGSVAIPCGRYKLDSAQVVAAIPAAEAFSFIGGGSDCTTLYTTSGSPLSVTLADPVSSKFHIRGFKVTTKAVNTGTALAISTSVSAAQQLGVGNDVTDVTFSGDDATSGSSPFHVDYFANDIVVTGGVSNINFVNLNDPGSGAVGGTGVSLSGTTNNYGINFTFINPYFYYKSLPIAIGNWIQGVQVANPEFVGGNNGIVLNGTAGTFFGLSVYGGDFACTTACISGTAGNPINNASIFGVTSFVPLAGTTSLISGEFLASSIIGNNFINSAHPGGQAIVTANGSNGVQISSNTFVGSFNIAGFFQTTSQNINMQNNIYNGPTFKSSPTSSGGTINIGGATQ